MALYYKGNREFEKKITLCSGRKVRANNILESFDPSNLNHLVYSLTDFELNLIPYSFWQVWNKLPPFDYVLREKSKYGKSFVSENNGNKIVVPFHITKRLCNCNSNPDVFILAKIRKKDPPNIVMAVARPTENFKLVEGNASEAILRAMRLNMEIFRKNKHLTSQYH